MAASLGSKNSLGQLAAGCRNDSLGAWWHVDKKKPNGPSLAWLLQRGLAPLELGKQSRIGLLLAFLASLLWSPRVLRVTLPPPPALPHHQSTRTSWFGFEEVSENKH